MAASRSLARRQAPSIAFSLPPRSPAAPLREASALRRPLLSSAVRSWYPGMPPAPRRRTAD